MVELGAAGFHGVNITVPFKASAWQAASDPSDEVVSTGVTNTLLLGAAGPTKAYNTDFSGFKWAYRRHFAGASPGTVAMLGAGGVGTATAAALVDLGATEIRIYDIRPDRSNALADMLRHRHPSVRADVAASAEAAVDGVDGVANGTPVGMYLQPGTPVELAAIHDQRWLFDAIYSPIETELMVRATEMNLARISGFDLFLGQAIDAFQIFTGARLAPDVLTALETRMRVVERETRLLTPIATRPCGRPTSHDASRRRKVAPGEQVRGESDMAGSGSILGNPVLRLEDPTLLTGEGKYVDDLVEPGMLYVALVRSPVAHGTINSVDVGDAASMPGVVAVFHAGNDLGMPAMQGFAMLPPDFNRPIFASERVRFVGDVIAAVVAESQAQANDAAAASVRRHRSAAGRPQRRRRPRARRPAAVPRDRLERLLRHRVRQGRR